MPDEEELDRLWAETAPAKPLEQMGPLSVSEALALGKEGLAPFRAAVIWGKAPLRDHPDNSCVLFRLVGDAEKDLRARVTEFQASGYKTKRYGISHGVIVLEDPSGVELGLCVDRRTSPRKLK